MERYRWAKEEFKEAQREKENVKNKKILAQLFKKAFVKQSVEPKASTSDDDVSRGMTTAASLTLK